MAGAEPDLGLILRTRRRRRAPTPEIARRDRRAARRLGRAVGDADGPPAAASGRRPAPRPRRCATGATPATACARRRPRSPTPASGRRSTRCAGPLVPLGQGSMAIEPTRALVAVDVNTGGDLSPGGGAQGQPRRRGRAAAPAPAARPRRPGRRSTSRRSPAPTARASSGRSPPRCAPTASRPRVAGWTPLGHLELQRKRARRPLLRPARGAEPMGTSDHRPLAVPALGPGQPRCLDCTIRLQAVCAHADPASLPSSSGSSATAATPPARSSPRPATSRRWSAR